jgi:hypothetical protein
MLQNQAEWKKNIKQKYISILNELDVAANQLYKSDPLSKIVEQLKAYK